MKKVLFLFTLVACGLLALSGSAHASEAIMDSPQRVSFASDTFSGQNQATGQPERGGTCIRG